MSRRSSASTPARSSTPGATRPSRSTSTLAGGARGRAAVPSGASTGEFEATELRDGGDAWGGKGVTRAVANVNGEIAAALTGADAAEQAALDRALIDLDGTAEQVAAGRQRDPRRLAGGRQGVGAADAGSRSTATSRPVYGADGPPTVLPVPMMNVLNGGAHADNSVDFQEFMVVPAGARELLRVPAGRHRGLPRAQGPPEVAGAEHGRRRRGRLRPRPALQRGGARGARRRDRGGRLRARARTSSSPSTRRRARSSRTAPTSSTHEGRTLSRGRARLLLGRRRRPLSDRLDRGRHGRGGLGRLEGAHRRDRRPLPARRRRPLRHQPRAPAAAGSRPASPTRSWSRSTRSGR